MGIYLRPIYDSFEQDSYRQLLLHNSVGRYPSGIPDGPWSHSRQLTQVHRHSIKTAFIGRRCLRP